MNQAYRVTQKCHKYDLLTLPDLTWGQPICNGGGSLHHSKAVNSVGVCYIFNSFYGALLEKKRFYKDSWKVILNLSTLKHKKSLQYLVPPFLLTCDTCTTSVSQDMYKFVLVQIWLHMIMMCINLYEPKLTLLGGFSIEVGQWNTLGKSGMLSNHLVNCFV